MICCALSAQDALHVFAASGKEVTYTWRKAHENSWNGGKSGQAPPGCSCLPRPRPTSSGSTPR